MKALILAAGEGTRLGALTRGRPKPMLPVGGRPLLEHQLDLLRHHGIIEVAINLHYKPQSIVEYLGDGSRFGVSITYSSETRLLGSAGAAKRLGWFFRDSFLVMYGDLLTDLDLSLLMERHRTSSGLATLALCSPDDPTRCGMVEVSAEGRVREFIEKPTAEVVQGHLANAGIYVLEPEVLTYIPPDRPWDFGYDVFPSMLALGLPLFAYQVPGYVLDIGTPDRYAQAEVDLSAGLLVPA
ncbi:MAG TPA: nucleotidyltransferase family protein [Chloroflexota bacterium]|jgi:NDP-sugar pyrophosphorylase family protein|nr:nucleotidyltransferase family protein [Chloroflexota bacterium]